MRRRRGRARQDAGTVYRGSGRGTGYMGVEGQRFGSLLHGCKVYQAHGTNLPGTLSQYSLKTLTLFFVILFEKKNVYDKANYEAENKFRNVTTKKFAKI